VIGRVQEFIDRRVPELREQIEAWQSKTTDRVQSMAFITGVTREWESIPLEEKQIPYLVLEGTFWGALIALRACATEWKADNFASGRMPRDWQADLANRLEVAYIHLCDRKPLPKDLGAGRRHHP
jgi:hypothetical protein